MYDGQFPMINKVTDHNQKFHHNEKMIFKTLTGEPRKKGYVVSKTATCHMYFPNIHDAVEYAYGKETPIMARIILDTSDFGDSHFQSFLSENKIEATKVNQDSHTIEYVADRPTIENMIDEFWETDKEEREYLKSFIKEV